MIAQQQLAVVAEPAPAPRMLSWQPVPRLYAGERVYVVGGGPSAKGLDWELLRGRCVVACNAAGFLLPTGVAGVTVVVDQGFLNMFRKSLRQYVKDGGLVLYAPTPGRPMKPENHWAVHIRRIQGRRRWGISTEQDHIRYNHGCGGSAINVVYLMGAREIVLLGFDCSVSKGSNWHSAYDEGRKAGRLTEGGSEYYQGVSLALEQVADDLDRLGVPCWNATCDSSPFRYRPLEEVL